MPTPRNDRPTSKSSRTPTRASRPRLEQVYVPDRASWRRWLSKHHASSPGIWLVFDRATHRPDRLPYEDAVEEALCFGWIDSTARTLSESQYLQLFTPRKPKGTWSKVNKARVERLIAGGRMRPPGLAAIERSKSNGGWESLDQVEALTVPPDLAAALDGAGTARARFDGLAPSARKGFLHWVSQAKRDETRARRIAEVVALVAAGRRSRHA